ncbi:MAG: hypothetical protein H3C57_06780 [Gammaproteobacteria bacterium]|nr:hypothetical protein [Gammaproteobacteria bacterium]
MATTASSLLPRRQPADDQQLLRLFWNRAELKRELERLRRDNERLLDQLRQQENAGLRSRQRLEQLENLLADPLAAANALVHYQLRGVWQLARKHLLRFARELGERQQEREEQLAREHFARLRGNALAAIDNRLAEVERRLRVVQMDLAIVDKQRGCLRGFWNWSRRRALQDQAAAIHAALDGLRLQVADIEAERRLREAEPCPSFPGLSVEARRHINLALIAMAQQLLIHFSRHDVARLARDASAQGLAEAGYGDVMQCQQLTRNIREVMAGADAIDGMAALVRHRAEWLRGQVAYRRDADTVPLAEALAVIPLEPPTLGDSDGEAASLAVNVLGEEYWDLYGILLP